MNTNPNPAMTPEAAAISAVIGDLEQRIAYAITTAIRSYSEANPSLPPPLAVQLGSIALDRFAAAGRDGRMR